MTPQERDLITHLLERLGKSAGQPKDSEAEALLRDGMARQPDAPYFLVQTVLIQDMALATAQNRIAELERQAVAPPPPQPTSFLGGLLGRSAPASGTAAPRDSGPWGQREPTAQPGSAQSPQAAPPPSMAQAMPMMASGGSGFLRQAAATAAGVAGGALLFDGIRSMFGYHAGGILGGVPMQPGLSETVINNYYGNDPGSAGDAGQGPGGPGDGMQSADYTPDPGEMAQDPGAQGADYGGGQDPGIDQGFADDQDFSSDQNFASDQDFGGDDNDLI